jgi:hypothetical protein
MPRMLAVTALQAIIEPHARRFGRAIWPVWKRYKETIAEEARLEFDLTTEANVLHSFMVAAVKREFSGVPGIQIVEENGFFLGIDGLPHGIPGQVACRLKKLDADGHSRNYPTTRAIGIRRNDPKALELEISDATVVDIGYVPDPLRTGIAAVQAIRLIDEALIMEIPREEDHTIKMPQPLHGRDSETGRGKRFEISASRQEFGPKGLGPGNKK